MGRKDRNNKGKEDLSKCGEILYYVAKTGIIIP